jgi:hypothetical protein
MSHIPILGRKPPKTDPEMQLARSMVTAASVGGQQLDIGPVKAARALVTAACVLASMDDKGQNGPKWKAHTVAALKEAIDAGLNADAPVRLRDDPGLMLMLLGQCVQRLGGSVTFHDSDLAELRLTHKWLVPDGRKGKQGEVNGIELAIIAADTQNPQGRKPGKA